TPRTASSRIEHLSRGATAAIECGLHCPLLAGGVGGLSCKKQSVFDWICQLGCHARHACKSVTVGASRERVAAPVVVMARQQIFFQVSNLYLEDPGQSTKCLQSNLLVICDCQLPRSRPPGPAGEQGPALVGPPGGNSAT